MEWDRLISDYLDDALGPEEVATLFQWIHSHPENAKRFARAAFLHRSLQHRLSAMRSLQEDGGLTMSNNQNPPSDPWPLAPASAENVPTAPALPAKPAKSRSSLTRWRVWGMAAAVLLVVGLLSFLVWPRSSPVRFLAAQNAKWGAGTTPPEHGDRLPKVGLVLDSGLIQIGFDDGNRLIIEGPARFSITDAHTITLDQGTLTAIVTPTGRGLCVSTPGARITDLGTEFGVRASATATHVTVFKGKVRVEGSSAGIAPTELSAGSAVEVSMAGITPALFDASAFKREMAAGVRPLDLVDLIAGGDGTGSASGVGIDAATGRAHETKAVAIRLGDHRYLPVTGHRVLDGCFIPGGNMPVDSAGHLFTFPATTLISYGLIWAGPNIPWEGELPIATTLPQDAATPTSRVLVMHSNNGVTLNLDAVRALHAQEKITGFRARVGNSYRPVRPDANPTKTLASVHVIVDGLARFEKLAFVNVDAPIDINCDLSDKDRFLTLATTDGGDGNSCDWVLWTHPEFTVEYRGQ